MHLVVGAGLSGCVIAERIANELNKKVLIIDKRPHIAGNIYDYRDEHGILVHKYGPHAFHTNLKNVWDYLSNFTEWKPYFHKVEALIDGQSVPIPFNFNTIEKLFPSDYARTLIKDLINAYGINKKVMILDLLKNDRFKELAQYVYEKVFLGYTVKQWGKKPEELDISVSGRVPIYTGRDDRYFHDKYQAIPENGYTEMIKKMLKNKNISVELESDFSKIDRSLYKKIIYTGKIDEYFNYVLGELPYRSLRFDIKSYDREYYQKTAQKNYSENFDFTRITEFKHFLDQKSKSTTVSYEYPQDYKRDLNEPYYPVPERNNFDLFEKYKELAVKEKNTIFLGRLAEYKYYNMDQIVESALKTFKVHFK